MKFSKPVSAADIANTMLGRFRGLSLPTYIQSMFLRRVRARMDLLFGCRVSLTARDAMIPETLAEIIEVHGKEMFICLEDFFVLVCSILARRLEN